MICDKFITAQVMKKFALNWLIGPIISMIFQSFLFQSHTLIWSDEEQIKVKVCDGAFLMSEK
jgi:hypothetical protein